MGSPEPGAQYVLSRVITSTVSFTGVGRTQQDVHTSHLLTTGELRTASKSPDFSQKSPWAQHHTRQLLHCQFWSLESVSFPELKLSPCKHHPLSCSWHQEHQPSDRAAHAGPLAFQRHCSGPSTWHRTTVRTVHHLPRPWHSLTRFCNQSTCLNTDALCNKPSPSSFSKTTHSWRSLWGVWNVFYMSCNGDAYVYT